MSKYPKPKDPRDSRKWREFRKMVLNRDGHTCAYCGEPANTVDHVNPISAHPEEAFNLDNCVSACRRCNSSKGARSEAVFLARQFTPPDFPANLSPRAASVIPENPFVTETTPAIN